VSDAEVKFKLITSAKQLGAPPPMRHEIVVMNGWKTADTDETVGFMVWEVTSTDYDAFIKSGWTFNPDGTRKHYTQEDSDIRLAAFTVRDPGGNRLWSTIEEAKQNLRLLGRASLDLLVMAANRVNSARTGDLEGNSDGTPKDSSPTT
jgi:hypothetical protein